MELPRLAVSLAIELRDFLFARVDGQRREVDAVRSHISNVTSLVQPLGNHHRLGDREAELAGRFLLKCRCGERRSGRTLDGMFGHSGHLEARSTASLKETEGLLMGGEAMIQLRLHLHWGGIGAGKRENGIDAVEWFAVERLHFALALDDQTQRYALHSTCRERRFHLAPQHGRQSKAHQTVEHAACLLCIDKVHVQMTGCLNGVNNGWFGNLVEHDAVGLFLVQTQHLAQMPRYGFSLPIFIGSQPYSLCVAGITSKFRNQRLFLLRNLVARLKSVQVYTQLLLFQVADVAIG